MKGLKAKILKTYLEMENQAKVTENNLLPIKKLQFSSKNKFWFYIFVLFI